MVVNQDNQSTMHLAKCSGIKNRTKHIDVSYHFIKDLVVRDKWVYLKYWPSEEMTADALTKPLGNILFLKHRTGMGLGSIFGNNWDLVAHNQSDWGEVSWYIISPYLYIYIFIISPHWYIPTSRRSFRATTSRSTWWQIYEGHQWGIYAIREFSDRLFQWAPTLLRESIRYQDSKWKWHFISIELNFSIQIHTYMFFHRRMM